MTDERFPQQPEAPKRGDRAGQRKLGTKALEAATNQNTPEPLDPTQLEESPSALATGSEEHWSGIFGEVEEATPLMLETPALAEEFVRRFLEEVNADPSLSDAEKQAVATVARTQSLIGRAENHTLAVLILLTNRGLEKEDQERLFWEIMRERFTKEIKAAAPKAQDMLDAAAQELILRVEPPKQIES